MGPGEMEGARRATGVSPAATRQLTWFISMTFISDPDLRILPALGAQTGIASFISVNPKLEASSPGMISGGNRRSLPWLLARNFFFFLRPHRDLFKSQRPIPIDHLDGAIEMLLDGYLGASDLFFDLIELPVIRYGKIVSDCSFCFNA